jgi:hypothetical protein
MGLEGEEAWPLTTGFSLFAELAGVILEEAGVTLDGFPGLLGFEAPVPGLTPELIGLLGFALVDEAAALLLDIGLDGDDA